MYETLVATKLYVPSLRPEQVARPHLVERLEAGLGGGRRLTLVSAPAGYGKTTLLAEWAAGRRVAWLSLDEDDNDLVRFGRYLVAAVRSVEPEVGHEVLHLLQAREAAAPEALGTALVNALDPLGGPLVLVLDDYHAISLFAIHALVAFVLEHLPPGVHLAIATRADPPLPLARLRARGQLTELRQAELRFTPAEAAQFLNREMGLNLGEGDVASLASRTEGWIAGLQMAALSLQGRENRAELVRAFAGSNRHILDYLIEEVLRHQPPAIQAFLLQTSILERLSGPLCDGLLAGDAHRPPSAVPAQETLESLEAANLFLVALDDERRWYRYHRLFADLLRRRLEQTWPERVPELHRRAGAWYEREGLTADAIDHALAAGDPERAAGLVEQAAEAILMRSEVATLADWIAALPPATVCARPYLCILHAAVLALTGEPQAAVEAQLEQALQADPEARYGGEVAAIRAIIALYAGDRPRSAELSRRALELLPADRLFLRSVAANDLALVFFMGGDLEAAEPLFEEVIRTSQQAGNTMMATAALCNLAGSHVVRGRLRRAAELYQRALELATDPRGRRLPVAGKALVGLGEVLRQWNDLEAAGRHLAEGIEAMKRYGEAGSIAGYASLALIKQAQGDVQGMRDMLAMARELATRFQVTDVDDRLVAATEARLALLRGETEAAVRWAQDRGFEPDARPEEVMARAAAGSPFAELRELELLIVVRLYLALGRGNDALAILRPLLSAAQAQGRMRRVIEMLILQGLALAQGAANGAAGRDDGELWSVLGTALALAEPEGFCRVFVEAGEPMARLLRLAVARGSAPDYARRLLAAFPGAVGGAPDAPRPAPRGLIEPLSERELEVLRLLATHLSSTEIGERLYLSANTVRFHMKNIYSKLGVHSRSEAVERAAEIKLL